jgi:hypothetical protein
MKATAAALQYRRYACSIALPAHAYWSFRLDQANLAIHG